MKTAIVSVSVATVWTKPESPRDIDQLALGTPVYARSWLASLTIDEKLGFYDNNAIQILYVKEESPCYLLSSADLSP